jgi:RNA polymerase sigma-70 factor (ECF subfamily)
MDETRLAAAFEERRPRLRGVAYRILGSVAESEEVVQEGWLRLQAADVEAIEDLDAWLTTVVARLALRALRGRRRIADEPVDAFPLEPVVSVEPEGDPEQEALLADAVGVALQVVIDSLGPAERLAFVLHDMFAVPFDEIAAILDRSPAATRQLASRARRHVRDATPGPEPEPSRGREVVDAYFAAAREGDLDGLAAVLAPDVVLRAHRRGRDPLVVSGAESVSRGAVMARELAPLARPALVNGTPGAVAYRDGSPFAILAFTVIGGRLASIDIFNDAELVPRLVPET